MTQTQLSGGFGKVWKWLCKLGKTCKILYLYIIRIFYTSLGKLNQGLALPRICVYTCVFFMIITLHMYNWDNLRWMIILFPLHCQTFRENVVNYWCRHSLCSCVLVKRKSMEVPQPPMCGWKTITKIGAWQVVSKLGSVQGEWIWDWSWRKNCDHSATLLSRGKAGSLGQFEWSKMAERDFQNI